MKASPSEKQSLIEDFEIEVCGKRFFLKRSLEVLRRAEFAVGPIGVFAPRMENGDVTSAELVGIYVALLAGEPGTPKEKDIARWAIFSTGVHAHRATAWFLMSLIVGTENLEAYIKSHPAPRPSVYSEAPQ